MTFPTFFTVIVHDIVLTIATDTATNAAARRASFLALDAIEGDPEFLTRTCDCRVVIQARKAARKANIPMLRSYMAYSRIWRITGKHEGSVRQDWI